MDTNDSWHLSKSVPLGLIIGLITQGAAIVWTVSMMMSDIESNRDDILETNLGSQGLSLLLILRLCLWLELMRTLKLFVVQ